MKRPTSAESRVRGQRVWPLLVFMTALMLFGCGRRSGTQPSDRFAEAKSGTSDEIIEDALTRRLRDTEVSSDARIARTLACAREGNLDAVPALLRVMRHRSQAAFLIANRLDGKGLRAVEFKSPNAVDHPMERVAAIVALETIGTPIALPDLLLALDDLNPAVQNHAARVLLRLGNRAGIPVLLKNLEGRVFACETANRILEEITGTSMDLEPDGGWDHKEKAVARWRAWFVALDESGDRLPMEGAPYEIGNDASADERIAFVVDMLGQYQFLYHEQARTTMQRMGVVGLPFLRKGVERGRANGNATLRAGVAQVLAQIEHPNARELLGELLGDSHGAVRSRATAAFGELGGEASLVPLQKALSDRDPAVALEALTALGRVGGVRALELLRAFDPSADKTLKKTRQLAIFEASSGKEMRDEALGLLLDPDLAHRNLAHAALVRMTGEQAGFSATATERSRVAAQKRYEALLDG